MQAVGGYLYLHGMGLSSHSGILAVGWSLMWTRLRVCHWIWTLWCFYWALLTIWIPLNTLVYLSSTWPIMPGKLYCLNWSSRTLPNSRPERRFSMRSSLIQTHVYGAQLPPKIWKIWAAWIQARIITVWWPWPDWAVVRVMWWLGLNFLDSWWLYTSSICWNVAYSIWVSFFPPLPPPHPLLVLSCLPSFPLSVLLQNSPPLPPIFFLFAVFRQYLSVEMLALYIVLFSTCSVIFTGAGRLRQG